MLHLPDRLKAARKMKGWSLEELSQNMGENKISKQALSKYENGEMFPSEETLLEICKALQISKDFFFRKVNVEIEKVNFRKLESFPVKLQDSIVAHTKDFVERYLELEEILGIESRFNVSKFTGIKINSPDDVEAAAKFIRKEWKLGNDPLYNVVELLEDHNIKVFECGAEDSFSGLSSLLKNKIAVIVLNNHETIPTDRKRFTALHELGHLVMDLENIPTKQHENYCHHFAGAMLIPRDKLIEEIGSTKRTAMFFSELGQLKKQYGISISALLFRLYDCGIISKTHCFSMMTEMRMLDIFKVEPAEYNYQGEERSNRFLQLLLRGVAMELISSSKAAALNNQKLSQFRKYLA